MADIIGTKRINGREKDVYLTPSGKRVTIWTRTVGQAFATEAIIRCGGRVLAVTDVFPYGFTGPAVRKAEELLETL